MREEPRIYKVLSLLFFLLALSFPIQVIFHTQLKLTDIHLSFNYLSDINMLLMMNFTLVSLGFYFARTFTAFFLVLSVPLVALNNYHIANLGVYQSSVIPFYTSILYTLVFLLFIQSKQFKAIADSNFQWWRTAPRYEIALKSYLHINNQRIELETINISKSGALLKSFNLAKHITTFQKNVGQEARIEIELGGTEMHTSKVDLIRISNEMQHFGSIALQFKEQSYLFQKSLKKLISRVESSIPINVINLCEKIETTI